MSRTMMSVFGQPSRPVDTRAAPPPVATPEKSTTAPELETHRTGASERAVTRLGKTLVLKGDLWVGDEVLLLGSVEGTFECGDSLTVGIGGTVVGDVRGRIVTVKGTVNGNIRGAESVVVAVGATVNGDIAAPRVTIVEGAQFNGAVKTSGPSGALGEIGSVDDQNGVTLTNKGVERLLGLLSAPSKD